MNSSRPYSTNEVFSICILAEVVVLHAFFVNIVTCFDFYTGIDDGNQVNALSFHILYQVFQVRKSFRIHCKILVPFHIINIQINAVKRNASSLILFCNGTNILFCLVSPATLSVSKCPEGRNVALSD